MDNLASFARLITGTIPGTVVPCIKILSGINIASRQQNAAFGLQVSFVYQSGGVVVQSATYGGLIKLSTFHQQIDSMWVDIHTPQLDLKPTPDAGTTFACSVKMTITDATGALVDCSPLDTQVLRID